MNAVVFDILVALVVLIIVLIGRYLVPYLNALVENTRYAWIVKWVKLAVQAAEQTIIGDKTGPEKKAIVTEFLKKQLQAKNISISDEQLNTLIEAAVYAMNNCWQ